MKDKKVRLSVANLVSAIVNGNTGERALIGIANKKRLEKEGKLFLQALGGAAFMLPESKRFLEEKYDAQFLGEGGDVLDARFVISEEDVDEVVAIFEEMCACECNPMREVRHELEEETFNGATVLFPRALEGVTSTFLGSFRQNPSDGKGASERAGEHQIQTRRLFFMHSLNVPNHVFVDILASPYVKQLYYEDLITTHNGTTKGVTQDGIPMADNLFLFKA